MNNKSFGDVAYFANNWLKGIYEQYAKIAQMLTESAIESAESLFNERFPKESDDYIIEFRISGYPNMKSVCVSRDSVSLSCEVYKFYSHDSEYDDTDYIPTELTDNIDAMLLWVVSFKALDVHNKVIDDSFYYLMQGIRK